MDVGQLAARQFIDFFLVAFDPVDIAQAGFTAHGSDRDIVRVLAVCCAHAEADDFAGGAFEQLLNVDVGGEFLPFNGENAVARGHIQAGLRERWFLAGMEEAAGVNLFQAVVVVFDFVVGAQQAARDFFRLWNGAAEAAQMADREGAQHLLEDVVELRARGDGGDVWFEVRSSAAVSAPWKWGS